MSKIKSIFCKLCSFKQINVEICSPPPQKKNTLNGESIKKKFEILNLIS